MLWSESVSARCRDANLFSAALSSNFPLELCDVIWEDSVVGPSGHVFCICNTQSDRYFYIEYKYDTFEKQPEKVSTFSLFLFADLENVKTWLRDLRAKNHPKAAEILPIMRFFLT